MRPITIDDKFIEMHMAEIGANAFSVLCVISSHLNADMTAFPSTSLIMRLTGLGRNSTYDAIKMLKDKGIIRPKQDINSSKKTFGRRTFKVETDLIHVQIKVSDLSFTENMPLPEIRETGTEKPLPEIRETGTEKPLPENPLTVNRETAGNANKGCFLNNEAKKPLPERSVNLRTHSINNNKEESVLRFPENQETASKQTTEPHTPPFSENISLPVEEEKTKRGDIPPGAAAGQGGGEAGNIFSGEFRYDKVIKFDTATELVAQMKRFYEANYNTYEVSILNEGKASAFTDAEIRETVIKWANYLIGQDYMQLSYRQLNAKLSGWFRQEYTYKQQREAEAAKKSKAESEASKHPSYRRITKDTIIE